MAVTLPDDPKQLKSLCERYQKQVKELTQKCERENLNWGMEKYYLTQKIRDFEKLCENNKIDFSIVNELDKKRRRLPSAKKEPVTEEQFLSVFARYYPHAHVYNAIDDGNADDIWVRTLGNTETDRKHITRWLDDMAHPEEACVHACYVIRKYINGKGATDIMLGNLRKGFQHYGRTKDPNERIWAMVETMFRASIHEYYWTMESKMHDPF